jgi:hypothetical protein
MNRTRTAVVTSITLTVAAIGFVIVMTPRAVTRAQALAVSQSPLPYSAAESIIVMVSPNNDAVYGFSTRTGLWQKETVKSANNDPITPLLFVNTACFQAGDRLYAFSGQRGSWHSIDLESGSKPKITLGKDMIIAMGTNRLYAFSSIAAHWDSVPIEAKSKS